MRYTVIYSDDFQNEVDNLYFYILSLNNYSDIADRLTAKILDMAESLNEMPKRFAEAYDTRLNSNLRKVTVDNFIILYSVFDERKEVLVHHVFYGGRDIDEIL